MITFKDLTVDDDKKSCYDKDKEVILTKTEYNLLLFLITNKNKIFNRKELSNKIWNTSVSDRAVDTTISRLRKKLKCIEKYLKTRVGFGYGLLE